MPYRNTVRLEEDEEAQVPYGAALRSDGSGNFGFKNLKLNPALAAEVPELHADPDLRALVLAINAPETGLFSLGCASEDIEELSGHRVSGYVAFAWNEIYAASSWRWYGSMFHNLKKLLEKTGFDQPFEFDWIIGRTAFCNRGVAHGWAATVRLNTDICDSREKARMVWARSLSALSTVLGAVPSRRGSHLSAWIRRD